MMELTAPENSVWIASYPRSGNTLMRAILWHCFGLQSASIYADEFHGDSRVGRHCGHIEPDENGARVFSTAPPMLKTHDHPSDDRKAIYIARNPRPASVSLWEFWQRRGDIADIVAGNHMFGSWADHINAWSGRHDTLYLTFEGILSEPHTAISRVSDFLGKRIINDHLPPRNADGFYVRPPTNWRDLWSDRLESLLMAIGGKTVDAMGYSIDDAFCASY